MQQRKHNQPKFQMGKGLKNKHFSKGDTQPWLGGSGGWSVVP